MKDVLYLFGYGSLMSHPELADRIVSRAPGRVRGYRRAFNKVSHARGCPASLAWELPEGMPAVPELGGPRGHRSSLALGTERCGGPGMVGLLLGYPAEIAEEVLAMTDLREGYDPDEAPEACGYLRVEVAVERLDGGGTVRAYTWVTNETPGARWRLPAGTPLDTRAAILAAATPREARQRPLGLQYLEDVRETLRAHGIVDDALEALASAARALPGPWAEVVAPPRQSSSEATAQALTTTSG